MATKNYTFPSDSSGGNDYQPDLTDTADIAVAFADFVDGVQSVFNSIGSDISVVDNKLDGTTDLSIPASRFILQGTQSANNIKFAVTNTGSITLNLPPATTTIVGTDSSQTLTNKTLSTATISGTTTLTGTVNASGATVNSPAISSPTISNPTITGSVTGDQDFNGNVNIDGTLAAGATSVSALTVNGLVIQSGYIPIPGMIVMYNGTTAPTGWAICDGTNGTPDLRDRFIIGAGSSFTLGATGGSYTSGGAGDHNHNTNGVSGGYTTNNAYTEHGHNTYHAHNTGSAGSHSHNSTTGTSNSNTTRDLGTGGGVAVPAHTHSFNTGTDGSHGHNVSAENPGTSVAGITHAHSGSFNTNGGSTSSQPGNHTHSTDRPLFRALTYIMKL
jgi:hypothetical protein